MNLPTGLRVGLLWMRLGPYHYARAAAAKMRLAPLGVELKIVEVASRDQYAWDPHRSDCGLHVTTLFPNVNYEEVEPRRIERRLLQWLTVENVDLIVVNGWAAKEARVALGWAEASNQRRAIVMSETKGDESPRRWLKEVAKRWLIRGVRAGLVGGRRQQRYLASLGVPESQIYLGYNAVDNAYFVAGSERARRESEHPLAGRNYFICVTRLIKRKNVDGLLRAYALYRDQVTDLAWDLVICGSGVELDALKNLCRSLGLDRNVHWVGFLQYGDLPIWYGHANAFVHPAKVEAWGLVVNEAAACSLPLLVSYSVGACDELVEDRVSGIRFSPHSDRDMAQALVSITDMPIEARLTMGEAARERVAEFGPARFAEGLLSAIVAARADTDLG